MIRLALGVGWSMTAGGNLGNLIRRLIVPRFRFIPGMRDKILDSKTPALHRSALVVKTHAPRQLAGTLCPNPLLADGQRLDDVIGDGFAFITAVAPDPAQHALLERCGAKVHVVQPRGELAEWLRRGHARAAIVRPDRTVMRAGRDTQSLCESMPTFTSVDERPTHA
jgi:3-(3-hydroxy-phenyl)propionate hydroxylase